MMGDLILYNGRVYTQDNEFPMVQAVVIKGNTIVFCGGNTSALKLSTENTRIIDLEGRSVLPGFIDSHFHFYEWVLNLQNLDFSKVKCFDAFLKLIHQRSAALEPGRWVVGHGFNETDWDVIQMPNRDDLDRVAPDHPVCVWRCDLHMSVANSMALKLAGIDQDTQDPDNGVIVRDESGRPNGVLKELASDLVSRVIPQPPDEVMEKNMASAIRILHEKGITAIHDVRLMEDFDGRHSLKNPSISQQAEQA
jgi:predicted amidohydrolase YtcJ